MLVIIARELQLMSTEALSVDLFSPFATASYPVGFRYGQSYRQEFTGLQLKASMRSFKEARLSYLIPAYVQLMQELQAK